MHPDWSVDDLVCHPDQAKTYCEQIRSKVGAPAAGSRHPSVADERTQGALEIAPDDFDHPAFILPACRLIRQGELMLRPMVKPSVIKL